MCGLLAACDYGAFCFTLANKETSRSLQNLICEFRLGMFLTLTGAGSAPSNKWIQTNCGQGGPWQDRQLMAAWGKVVSQGVVWAGHLVKVDTARSLLTWPLDFNFTPILCNIILNAMTRLPRLGRCCTKCEGWRQAGIYCRLHWILSLVYWLQIWG